MVWCRADLIRIKAALDRDPFADPVRAGPFTFSRKKARRLERELTAKFSALPSGRTEQAAVTAHSQCGGQSFKMNTSRFQHCREVTQP